MTEISLVAPNIIEIGSFHITNTVMGGFMTTLICVIIILVYARKPKLVPGRMQVLFEMMVNAFTGFLRGSYPGNEKRVRAYAPFYLTLFFYLLVANQFSNLPLLSSITAGADPKYIFKMSTADFSQTITLALIAIGSAHLIAFSKAPIKHINNFLKFDKLIAIRKPADVASYLLDLFLGMLDIIGELAKIISLSARLFGNIFAGDVMVTVIASISVFTTYLVPVPFLFLGAFSSLVQAFVFAILCLQFMAGTITSVESSPKVENA